MNTLRGSSFKQTRDQLIHGITVHAETDRRRYRVTASASAADRFWHVEREYPARDGTTDMLTVSDTNDLDFG
jgi:hypothetical protein